jgi:hypothetical protein
MIESNALPSWAYGDPEQVVIRRQEEAAQKERACGQCRERVEFNWKGDVLITCGMKHTVYGRRCEHFRIKPTKGESQ